MDHEDKMEEEGTMKELITFSPVSSPSEIQSTGPNDFLLDLMGSNDVKIPLQNDPFSNTNVEIPMVVSEIDQQEKMVISEEFLTSNESFDPFNSETQRAVVDGIELPVDESIVQPLSEQSSPDENIQKSMESPMASKTFAEVSLEQNDSESLSRKGIESDEIPMDEYQTIESPSKFAGFEDAVIVNTDAEDLEPSTDNYQTMGSPSDSSVSETIGNEQTFAEPCADSGTFEDTAIIDTPSVNLIDNYQSMDSPSEFRETNAVDLDSNIVDECDRVVDANRSSEHSSELEDAAIIDPTTDDYQTMGSPSESVDLDQSNSIIVEERDVVVEADGLNEINANTEHSAGSEDVFTIDTPKDSDDLAQLTEESAENYQTMESSSERDSNVVNAEDIEPALVQVNDITADTSTALVDGSLEEKEVEHHSASEDVVIQGDSNMATHLESLSLADDHQRLSPKAIDEDEDDFGDFEEAPPVSKQPFSEMNHRNSIQSVDSMDEFGDFGDFNDQSNEQFGAFESSEPLEREKSSSFGEFTEFSTAQVAPPTNIVALLQQAFQTELLPEAPKDTSPENLQSMYSVLLTENEQIESNLNTYLDSSLEEDIIDVPVTSGTESAKLNAELAAYSLQLVESALRENLSEVVAAGILPDRSEKFLALKSAIDTNDSETMLDALDQLKRIILEHATSTTMLKLAQDAAFSAEAALASQSSSSGKSSSIFSRSSAIPDAIAEKRDCDSSTMRILTPTGGNRSKSGFSTDGGTSDSDTDGGGSLYSDSSIGPSAAAIDEVQPTSRGLMKKFSSRLTASLGGRSKQYRIQLRRNEATGRIMSMALDLDQVSGGFDQIKWQCAKFVYDLEQVSQVAPSQIILYSHPDGRQLQHKSNKQLLNAFLKSNAVWAVEIQSKEHVRPIGSAII